MNTQPRWNDVEINEYPRVDHSSAYDVVVIGGGITGLTAAYFLKQSGKKVCVLERDRLGRGDTGYTTAHLTHVTDLRLSELVRTFGREAARLAWQGGAAAIEMIEAIVHQEAIDCGFRRIPGYLHASLSRTTDEADTLKQEAELAVELGFEAAFDATAPVVDRPSICFPNQAKFHPRAYLAGLAKAVDGDGSAIFERSEVDAVESDPLVVRVGEARVACDYVVIATHVPLMGQAGLISATLFQTKLFGYSSYALAADVAADRLDEASYWDTSDPYYYLRVDRDGGKSSVIVGGEDHKTGQVEDTESCYARLEETLLRVIPEAHVTHRWSGQVIETNDGLPYIGETAERQFAATGFAGNGMTFGTLAGLMACDAACGRSNPWQELFDVSRKKLRGGTWEYLKENVDFPYFLVRDRVSAADGTSTRAVKRGQGRVLKLDGQRVACYRDEQGKLTQVSAVCTHMGCLVHWNEAETTWDCPCHGSRFHTDGTVLAGPAETPLERISRRERVKQAK